jgi:hypothetical protein
MRFGGMGYRFLVYAKIPCTRSTKLRGSSSGNVQSCQFCMHLINEDEL